ncbi:MAG: OmpA family protein [Bacteroidetes bacterium]|nr:OmpA family protein [Bacteroidota bacterium]
MLDVRQSEVERSEARARQSQQDASRDRASADSARQRADESRVSAEDARRQSALLAERISELEARPTDRGLVLTLGDVLFEFGKSSMRSGGMKSIDDLAAFLNEYPERKIMIEGFTDNVGSEAFNLELSRNRANAVKSELVSRGISGNRVDTIGYGFQFPVGNNATDAGRQQNRRVEIIISDDSGNVSRRSQ